MFWFQIILTDIPLNKLGFNSLEQYIRSIPHCAKIEFNKSGEPIVKGVPNEKTRHICRLVSGQKRSSRKQPRFTARGGRNGFFVSKSKGRPMLGPTKPPVAPRFLKKTQQQQPQLVTTSRTYQASSFQPPPRMLRVKQQGKWPVNLSMGINKDVWEGNDDQNKLRNKMRLHIGHTLKSIVKNYWIEQSAPEDVVM